jgi:hypothetical protein
MNSIAVIRILCQSLGVSLGLNNFGESQILDAVRLLSEGPDALTEDQFDLLYGWVCDGYNSVKNGFIKGNDLIVHPERIEV